MYQMTLLGLMAFVDTSRDGVLVMLPNGVGYGTGIHMIPDHKPHFYIEKKRIIDAANWWTPVEDEVLEARGLTVLPISEPCTLELTGMEEPSKTSLMGVTAEQQRLRLGTDLRDVLGVGELDASRHTPFMPSLNELDRRFKVDLEKGDTIARFMIRNATLFAYRLAQSAVTTLFVNTPPDPVTITATTSSGQTKQLVVNDGTEILLSHMSSFTAPHVAQGAPSHINIFRRLDPASTAELREPKKIHDALTPLYGPSRHPFVWYLRTRFGDVPRPGCSGLVYSSRPQGCRPW